MRCLKYKLIGNNNYLQPLETVLSNRGIEDVDTFLNARYDSSVVTHYSTLKNIDRAVNAIIEFAKTGKRIWLKYDPDVDGITSNSEFILYLQRAFPNVNITYGIPKGKEHGVNLDEVPEDIDLAVLIDSSTNDLYVHEELHKRGITTIVIDHHESDLTEFPHAIVVNNQLSSKANKEQAAVGVCYLVCKALDDKLNLNYADEYLDLVAIGNIGDSRDMRDKELRYYVTQGLSNIKNPFVRALLEDMEYQTKGIININAIAYNFSPYLNACVRVGNMDEKELLFKAFLSDENVKVKYKDEEESIHKNAIRILKRVRLKQNKMRDESMVEIEKKIEEKNLLDNKILIVEVTDILDKTLAGLVAGRMANANHIKRPVMLLRFTPDGKLSGSARGLNNSAINDLKQFVNDSGYFELAQGHANAHGIRVTKEGLVKFNEYANEKLKDIEISANVYDVDFVLSGSQLNYSLIHTIDSHADLWGKSIESPLLAIEKIEIPKRNVQLLGKNKNTIKWNANGVEYIKFFSNEDEYKSIVEYGDNGISGTLVMNVCGGCSINEFRGKRTGQILVEDYEIIEEKAFEFAF